MLALKAPRPTPTTTFPEKLIPAGNAWPTDANIRPISERLVTAEAFSYFCDLQIGCQELQHQFKTWFFEIKNFSSEDVKRDSFQEKTLGLWRQLDAFLLHCPTQPHYRDSLEYLKLAKVDLEDWLSQVTYQKSQARLDALLPGLHRSMIDFFEAASEFFKYEVLRYTIDGFGKNCNSALTIPHASLMRMAGEPAGVIYDVDDCIAWSEHAQKLTWKVAIEAWAKSAGFFEKDPLRVERLVSCVKYCFAKDHTGDMMDLLYRLCVKHRFCRPDDPSHDSPKNATELEACLIDYRAEALCRCVEMGTVTFTHGAEDQLLRHRREGRKIAICTNTPKEVSERMLQALFIKSARLPEFDELIKPEHRVFGDSGPVRKPNPLMWMMAAERLALRPEDALVYDNSLGNCDGASSLSRFNGDHYIAEAIARGVITSSPKNNFAGVVGVTNGFEKMPAWRSWARLPQSDSTTARKTVRVTVKGLEHIS